MHGLRVILAKRITRCPHFQATFVCTKYTSNMAACNDNGVHDVAAPHLYNLQMLRKPDETDAFMHTRKRAAEIYKTNLTA